MRTAHGCPAALPLQRSGSEGATRVSPTGSSAARKRPCYPKWAASPHAAFRAQLLAPRKGFDRRRLTYALLLSLLLHTLLLRLTFDGQGLGFPSLTFFWQDRRVAVSELRVLVLPVPDPAPTGAPVAEPLEQATATRIDSGLRSSSRSRAPVKGSAEVAIAPKPARAKAKQSADARLGVAPTEAPVPAPPSGDVALPQPIPPLPLIAVERTVLDTWVVPTQPEPAPIVAAAPSAGDRAQARVDPEPSEGVVGAMKPDASAQDQRKAEQLEAARQEAARQEAARQEAARQEAARQEAARQEAARQEAARQEAARQEAARQEAARQKPARQDTARQDAARQDAARQDAARQDAARQDAARQDAARQEAARRGEQEAAERREATLRAIGRQLDEEAAKREAAAGPARQSPSLPYSLSSARRYRLFGRTDPNAEIVRYAETWSRKIELSFTFDMWREVVNRPHTDPVVIVAVRSDGSLESVTFAKSTGVPAIDEAIRRIVDSQKPYLPFPPELARDYDVIEIRRNWHFDVAVRLY